MHVQPTHATACNAAEQINADAKCIGNGTDMTGGRCHVCPIGRRPGCVQRSYPWPAPSWLYSYGITHMQILTRFMVVPADNP